MQNWAQKKYMRFTGADDKEELENENENRKKNFWIKSVLLGLWDAL